MTVDPLFEIEPKMLDWVVGRKAEGETNQISRLERPTGEYCFLNFVT